MSKVDVERVTVCVELDDRTRGEGNPPHGETAQL